MTAAPMIDCPVCAERIRAQAKMCRFCKSVLDPEGLARLAGQGERRLLTDFLSEQVEEYRVGAVLFVDLVGFSALNERIAPEEMKQTLDSFYEVCNQAVDFYNGFILKFQGDATMAVFGAPHSHDRDVECAVHAALQIREQTSFIPPLGGESLRIHAGIATGEILASFTRHSSRNQFDIFGHSVDLAARITGAAAPGSILICPQTRDSVGRLFDLGPARPCQFKNIQGTTLVSEVLGPKNGLVDRRDNSIGFIGRVRELTVLENAWTTHRVCVDTPPTGRKPGGAVISGEPGIGKSRLAREFLARRQAEPAGVKPTIICHEGNPFDPRIPYAVWRAVIAQLLKRGQQDFGADAFHQLAAALKLKGERFSGLQAMCGIKAALAQVQPLGVRNLRQQIIAELKLLLARMFQKRPCFLLLDDLQWADEASLEVLQALAAAPLAAELFILVACRGETRLPPEVRAVWPRIRLRSLPEPERRLLLRKIASGAGPALMEQLALQSDGNPLYLMELARFIGDVDRQAASDESLAPIVPLTLKSIIQSRIDLLDRRRKMILQYGAVIGQKFTFKLMDAIEELRKELMTQLNALAGLEYIESRPLPSDLEFSFRHKLVRETAYQSLLLRQRQRFHGLVAERIEALYASRLEDYFAVLAWHFDKAGQREQAIYYSQLAGDRALAQGAASDALGDYERAIDLLLGVPAPSTEEQLRAAALLCATARLLRITGKCEKSLKALGRARLLPACAKDPMMQPRLAIETGLTHIQVSAYDEAARELAAARSAMGSRRQPALQAMLANALGLCAWGRGDFSTARQHYERTRDLAERAGLLSLGYDARNNLALLAWKNGCLQEALEGFRDGLRIARKLTDRFAIALTFLNMGIIEENLGRFDRAGRHYRDAQALAERIQFTQIQGAAFCNLGNLHLIREEWTAALEDCARALEIARTIDDRRSAAIALENLALAHIGLLQHDACRECLREARSIARKLGDAERSFSLDLVEIEWLIHQGQVDSALRRLEQARRRPERNACISEVPRLLRLRAHALQSAGRAKESAAAFLEAQKACASQANQVEAARLARLTKL